MGILCSLGWHRPAIKIVRNRAFRFSACATCGIEIVDQGDGVWRPIPRGFRVVWRPVANARTVWEDRSAHGASRSATTAPEMVRQGDVPAADTGRVATPPPSVAPLAAPATPVAPAPLRPSDATADPDTRKPGILTDFWERVRSLWPAGAEGGAPASRSYRYLAQQLMVDFPPSDRAPIILVSAACTPATEVSATMLLAAMMQDEMGGRLLIVDATLREGGIGDALGHADAPGFLDLLADSVQDPLDLARPSGREHIWVIPAGRAGSRAPHGPDAAHISQIFDAWARVYEHVIVVQQAITTDTRYLPIARAATVVLMMVEEAESRMADITRCTEALSAHGVADVRIVLCAEDTAALEPAAVVRHAA